MFFSSLTLTATLFFQAVAGPRVVVQSGLSKAATRVAFSPDGNLVAAGGEEGVIVLWDWRTNLVWRQLRGHTGGIRDFAFAPDGQHLASVARDGAVMVWDLRDGSAKSARVQEDADCTFCHVAFAGNGKLMISAAGGLVIYDAATLVAGKRLSKESVNALAVSPDGNFAAVAEMKMRPSKRGTTFIQNEIAIHNLKTAGVTKLLARGDVACLVFSADGSAIYAGAGPKKQRSGNGEETEVGNASVTGWDLKSRRELVTWATKSTFIQGLAVAGQTGRLASTSYEAELWDPKSRTNVPFKAHPPRANDIALSPNGQWVAVTLKSLLGGSGSIEVREIATNLSFTLTNPIAPVNQVAFLQDGRFVVARTARSAVVWDTSLGKLVRSFPGASSTMALSGDGKVIAVGGEGDGDDLLAAKELLGFSIFSLSSGKKIGHIDHAKNLKLGRLLLNQDGSIVRAFGSFFDTTTPAFATAGSAPSGAMQATSTPSMRLGDDGEKLMYREQGSRLVSVPVATEQRDSGKDGFGGSTLYSDDGHWLLKESSGSLQVSSPHFHVDYHLPLPRSGFMRAMAWSDDARLFAFSRDEAGINVYETRTGKLLHTLPHVAGVALALAFNPDHSRLVTGGGDGTTRIWSLAPLRELAAFVYVPQSKSANGGEDEEYVVFTPDGFYRSSKHAAGAIGFSVGISAYPFEQFDARFNRPDLVLQSLGLAPKQLINTYAAAYKKRLRKLKLDETAVAGAFVLPEVRIDQGSVPPTSSSGHLSLKVHADGQGVGLRALNVYVNGTPIFGAAGRPIAAGKSLTADEIVEIELSDRDNRIQATVVNASGLTSLAATATTTVYYPTQPKRLFVVAMGVSRYKDNSKNLEFAAKDASDVSAFFASTKARFAEVNIKTYLDDKVTKESIADARAFLLQSKVGDEVVVFAAGHGLIDDKLDYYFATHDIDFDNPQARGLLFEDIEGLFDGVPARQRLLLVDTCHSGEFDKAEMALLEGASAAEGKVRVRAVASRGVHVTERLGIGNLDEVVHELFTDIRRGSGAFVISSSAGAEFAFEGSDWKNGVFTYAVLSGLKDNRADANANKKVSASELSNYVAKTVSELTQGKQNPKARADNPELDFGL